MGTYSSDEIRYRCIVCKSVWGSEYAPEGIYSDGLCRVCYRERCKEIIWRRQDREGYQKCYARGYEDCSENGCAFFDTCLDKNLEQWKKLIIPNDKGIDKHIDTRPKDCMLF